MQLEFNESIQIHMTLVRQQISSLKSTIEPVESLIILKIN